MPPVVGWLIAIAAVVLVIALIVAFRGPIARFVMAVCALVVIAGLLTLAMGTANELFGWDLWGWGDEYPNVNWGSAEDESSMELGSFGQMWLDFGLMTLGSAVLGSVLFAFWGDAS